MDPEALPQEWVWADGCKQSSKASGWSGDIRRLGVPLTCPPRRGPALDPTHSAGARPAEWSGASRCGPHWGPLLARNPGLPAPASPLGGQQSLCPQSHRAAGHHPGPFPSPPVPEEMGIWGSDVPSGINKTNGQNRTPAFLRRQEPQSSEGRECSGGSLGCQRVPRGAAAPNGLGRKQHPQSILLSPHHGTGRMRFRILGPKGQDTLRPLQLRACWPG